MRTLRISVRRLVEFLLRTGNIDSQSDWHGGIEAMQAGSNIHRMLQAQGGEAYQAEVSLACSVFFPNNAFSPHAARLQISEDAVGDQEGFFLCVEGRADGIVDNGINPLVIDEIKGTERDVSSISEPVAMHEAQALCYAYLYLRRTRGSTKLASSFGEQVAVRLTYASMTTGEVRQLERTRSVPDIEAWFFQLLEKAQRWAEWRVRHDELRAASIASLEFPFVPRVGQRQIMDAVASAIREGKRLYVQAPTGSGKTIATLYPALKSMGLGETSHIAYLTAKTMTRRAALECLDLLRRQRIAANVLVVTARNKICPLRSAAHDEAVRARPLVSLCNPLECPRARGHYDSVNDALFEAISTHDVLDFARIEHVAARHHVCPYELQRDVARWADVVVCDYHFAFAPSASLMGLADEPGGADTVFLVDEAHNLIERMRSMYSAELALGDLAELERILSTQSGLDELLQAVHAVMSAFPTWDKSLPVGGGKGSNGRGRRGSYQVVHTSDAFEESLTALVDSMDAALEQVFSAMSDTHGGRHNTAATNSEAIEAFLALRDVNYSIRAFLGALQRSETGYVTFVGSSDRSGRRLKVFCVDPSHDLGERLEQAGAAVFFSGTLLPVDYHRKLLAGREDDASAYAKSSFDYSRQQVLIGSDVNTRYSKRGPKLYAHIAKYIVALVHAHPGNHLVFLPSYAMVEEVAKALVPLADSHITLVRQRAGMRESEREDFVSRFAATRDTTKSLVGLCVLGGIFGESIDLPGEALVGVVVVGTGMPGICDEREVMRDYFDVKCGKGFAYAYTYPGMIKVLQAAGRLMRTENDHGVVLLLDDRFLEHDLRQAFPKEWTNVRACTLATLAKMVKANQKDQPPLCDTRVSRGRRC
ncbi:MAG: ATP-dependent DNA helicase [Coriobacteriales bacterium]|nr:ATP-dependent DNA helicase [Coriobacteriales bacterium]